MDPISSTLKDHAEWQSPVAMGHPAGGQLPTVGAYAELIRKREQEMLKQECIAAHSHAIQDPGHNHGWPQAYMTTEQIRKVAESAGLKQMGTHCLSTGEKPKTTATNPKQLYGDKKPPVHLIHQIAELHESAALHAGKRKYGENNYIATEVEAMTYVGAILRHVKAWASGERVDPKELVHHLGAVKACCTILMTTEATGMLIDNRPTTAGEGGNVKEPAKSYQQATSETFAEVEKTIEHLNKLYPEPK